MPEGDTVLRTARRLDAALSGRPLLRSELRWGELGDADLAGRTVLQTVSYGKQLLTRLAAADDRLRGGRPGGPRRPQAPPEPLTLRSHLRMEGRWAVHATGARPWPSARQAAVRAVLEGTDWTAVGTWLGLLDLIPTDQEPALVGHLGPDILAPDFPQTGRAEAIARLSTRPDREIGAALLDQTTVAGIGTMYMAEALFARGISPWTPVAEVDLGAVLDTARRQLHNGATQAVPTTTGNNQRGKTTYAHARSGNPCLRCGGTIRVAQIGVPPRQRPAFYCPHCQPGPTPTDDGRPQSPLGSNPAIPYFRRPAGYRRDR